MKLSKARIHVTALLLGQFLIGSAVPAFAVTGGVTIAGKTVLVNKAGFGDESAQERTRSIQNNLDNALVAAKDHSPASVHVSNSKTPIITVGGYKIVSVDGVNAKLAKTTTTVLAKRWADSIRKTLSDSTSVDNYIAQLSGNSTGITSYEPAAAPQRAEIATNTVNVPAPNCAPAQSTNDAPPPVMQGHVIYAPAGLNFPITLATAISTQVAKAGDLIEAQLSENVYLGQGFIPAGSIITGEVTDAEAGRRLDRSGSLSIRFNRLRLPNGQEVPIVAHIVGGIGKYVEKSGADATADTVHGETMKNKVESVAIRGLVGAGSGAALGTAVGAIAGGKHGVGKGAWSGTAIGAGVGVADSLLLRKAADVVIPSGTRMDLELEAPLSIAAQ